MFAETGSIVSASRRSSLLASVRETSSARLDVCDAAPLPWLASAAMPGGAGAIVTDTFSSVICAAGSGFAVSPGGDFSNSVE